MIGDGANDGAAIRESDLGISFACIKKKTQNV
jgi:magnesium-transporting ATPase (P-type)